MIDQNGRRILDADSVLLPGTVLKVRSGLKYVNLEDNSLQITRDQLTLIVESSHFSMMGSEDDHFEECQLVIFRFLGSDGSYDSSSPRGQFATAGDYRPEFIDASPQVLGFRNKTFQNLT